jgi:hypothetical protein
MRQVRMKPSFVNKTLHFNMKLMQVPYFEHFKGFKLPVRILNITQKHELFNRHDNPVCLDEI